MTVRHACDGSSCYFRHAVQRVEFIKDSVMVRRAYDGPSCHFVAKFREFFSVSNFSEFYVFWNETLSTVRRAHDGPSWDPSTQTVTTRNKLYCSKRLTGHYNRYQFTHRSSPNDHKKKNKGEKEYMNLKIDVGIFLVYQPPSPKWTFQLTDSSTEP